MRIRTFARRAVVPNILPTVTCAAVLFALHGVASHSVYGLFLAAAAGCVTYVVTYFLTGATRGEKHRGFAFVTRPLPRRWRPDVVPVGPMSHDDPVA
jgi:hypothetical protein